LSQRRWQQEKQKQIKKPSSVSFSLLLDALVQKKADESFNFSIFSRQN